MRIYLDSCVFISFVREEIDSALNARYLESADFFAFCRMKNYTLVFSNLFFDEIFKVLSLNKMDVLDEFKRLNIEVDVFEKKMCKNFSEEISRKTGLHFSDSVHVAFAIESKSDVIVTWNLKDFKKAKDYIESVNPLNFADIF